MKRDSKEHATGFCLCAIAIVPLLGAAVLLEAKERLPAPAERLEQKPSVAADPKWKVVKPDPSKKAVKADNSYCLVCHVNLEEEEIVDVHLDLGVGCETCHGVSYEHSADEDNLTPPEVMWSKDRINPRCMTCHARHELLVDDEAAKSHREVFKRWKKRDPTDTGPTRCTQCHGEEHRSRHRTRIWDKENGELLMRSGDPNMDR